MSEDRPLSYAIPADVLALMLDGFLTIEEGQAKYRRAGGDIRIFDAFVRQHRHELVSDGEID